MRDADMLALGARAPAAGYACAVMRAQAHYRAALGTVVSADSLSEQ